MEKTVVNCLVNKANEGQFRYVVEFLISNKPQVNTHDASRIIVACCHSCITYLSKPEMLREKELCQLMKIVTPFVTKPSSRLVETYLQSVFHITKFLVEKKAFKLIATCEDLFLPSFLPETLTPKQDTVLQGTSSTIYNSIVIMAKDQRPEDPSQKTHIMKLCYLTLLLTSKVGGGKNLLHTFCQLLKALYMVQIDHVVLHDFYCQWVDSIVQTGKLAMNDTTLIPLFKTYLIMLEKQDFNKAFNCSEKAVLVVQSEADSIGKLLKICSWLVPSSDHDESVLRKCQQSVKLVHEQFGGTTLFSDALDVILSTMGLICAYYKDRNVADWTEKVSPQIQLEFYQFICDLVGVDDANTVPDDNRMKLLSTIITLSKLYVLNLEQINRDYISKFNFYLKSYVRWIFYIKNDAAGKWTHMWQSSGAYLYNTGQHLFKIGDYRGALSLLEEFVKALIKLEGFKPVVIDRQFLLISLNTITDIYFNLEEYEKLLSTAAFTVAIALDNCEVACIKWIKAKSVCRENGRDDLQELTMNTAIKKYKSKFCSNFKLEKNVQLKVLQTELSYYKAKWKSKVPMMAAYREICDLAEPLTRGKIFTETWGDADLLVHDQIPKLLAQTVAKFKVEVVECLESKAIEAHLLYLHHKYQVKDMIIKTCDDIDKTMHVPKEINSEDPDSDQKCDIVSAYEALKMTNYLEMMVALKESLAILKSILSDISRTSLNLIAGDKMYNLLRKIGFEYRLHSDSSSCRQVWKLALRVAELLNCLPFIIESVSFLLDVCDPRHESMQKLISKAELAIDKIDTVDYKTYLITYYLYKADAYLPYDFCIANTSFQSALKLSHDSDINPTVIAKLNLIHQKFILLPCSFEIEGHQDYGLVKIHAAYLDCIQSYQANRAGVDCPYDVSVLLEVSRNMAGIYYNLRMPRELICYCKQIIFVAQKLVLPFQTMSLLYYLANADILSCNMNDCRVKLRDFSEILCLSKMPEQHCQKNKKIEYILEELSTEFQGLMLDLPRQAPHQDSSGSPTFSAETFKFPVHFKHSDGCQCFYCSSVEYNDFILKKTYLDALYYVHDDNAGLAKEYFYGCFTMYRSLALKWTDSFLETYCYVLLQYGNAMLGANDVGKAANINKKLVQLLLPMKNYFAYLYNDALLQKLNVLASKTAASPQVHLSPCSEPVSNADGPKTPENKISQVHIPCSVKKIATTKKTVKSIKFNISLDEEDEAPSKKSIQMKNLPPFLCGTNKTPAPSAVKACSKASRRRKNILDEASQESVLETSSTVPTSPNALKFEAKINSALASRTKLLTQKLKASNKHTPIPSINITDVSETDVSKKTKRAPVRKNLSEDLKDASDKGQSGTIRRSQRTRK